MPQHHLPDAGFDRIAAFYDALAQLVFGQALRRAQRAALTGLPAGAPTVLVIGGGSGWVLGELLRARPRARILYVEASPVMLQKSRASLQRLAPTQAAQVEFRLGTEAAIAPAETFDAIVTFFFLDLFEPQRLRAVLNQLHTARRPGAAWLVADFCPPTRLWQRLLVGTMYRFFRLTTGISGRQLPDLPAAMHGLGLQRRLAGTFYGQLLEAAVYTTAASSPHR